MLKGNVCKSHMPISQSETCTINDGMAAIQSLANSSGAKTFGEWSDRFLCHVTIFRTVVQGLMCYLTDTVCQELDKRRNQRQVQGEEEHRD